MNSSLLTRVWSHLQAQIDVLKEDVTMLKSKTSNAAFPTRWTALHMDSLLVSGAALANTFSTSAFMNMYTQQSPAVSGDSFTNGFNLKSGTYTLRVYGQQDTNCGIVYWYIDNVYQGAQDWYGAVFAGSIRNTTVEIESDGPHSLRGLVYLKNFSSTGFAMKLTAMTLIPGVD